MQPRPEVSLIQRPKDAPSLLKGVFTCGRCGKFKERPGKRVLGLEGFEFCAFCARGLRSFGYGGRGRGKEKYD